MTVGSGDGSVSGVGTVDPDLQPGQQVGEYVVDCKVGEGGFGQVFKATHPVIGKEVAVKVLSRQYSSQPEMVSRFVSEARAVNQIRHRNIIDIFSFSQLPDGRHYYVMEYLPGEPLDEYLSEAGRLTLAETLPLLRGIARALDAAHEAGIAHRDLKPENIYLVDEDGVLSPKLLDFGVAKLLTNETEKWHKTRTGAPIGTPYYMSPEQARGRNVDHRTDIYALGVVAFKMLTGEVPFDGEGYMDILLKQIEDDPPPPSSVVPDLPAGVDQAIAWMMSKNPDDRPQTATAAVESLTTAAGNLAEAAPSGTGRRVGSLPGAAGSVEARGGRFRSGRRSAVSAGDAALGSAPTVGAEASAPPDAFDGFASAETMAAASALSQEFSRQATPRSRAITWIGTFAGAAAIGGLVFWALSSLGRRTGHGVEHSALRVSSAKQPAPAPAPAPAPPVSAPPARKVEPAASPVPGDAGHPNSVRISVAGPPKGTKVYAHGAPVGVAPGKIWLPRGSGKVPLTFNADGYQATTQSVTPDHDRQVKVHLKRAPKPRRHARRTSRVHHHHRHSSVERGRDAIDNPFTK